MRRYTLITLILLVVACKGQAQTTPTGATIHMNHDYVDIVSVKDTLWALTTDGKILRFDLRQEAKFIDSIPTTTRVQILVKDKKGDIVIADQNNTIKKFDRMTGSWSRLYEFHGGLYGIVFDSQNKCFLLTDKGVYDCADQQYYFPEHTVNDQLKPGSKWFKKPVFLMDKQDNLWIGFAYGEWGGALFVFNTVNKEFTDLDLDSLKITLHPIVSIFEGYGHVYVSSGLMHFYTSGCIAFFDRFEAKVVFESDTHRVYSADSTHSEMVAGEYIGPGTYNERDSCIYFYSHNGIFKGSPDHQLDKIEQWTKVLSLQLHWSDGQPDAVGSPMNVTKLQFINASKLVFVSKLDGIGIYDGKMLTFIH